MRWWWWFSDTRIVNIFTGSPDISKHLAMVRVDYSGWNHGSSSPLITVVSALTADCWPYQLTHSTGRRGTFPRRDLSGLYSWINHFKIRPRSFQRSCCSLWSLSQKQMWLGIRSLASSHYPLNRRVALIHIDIYIHTYRWQNKQSTERLKLGTVMQRSNLL